MNQESNNRVDLSIIGSIADIQDEWIDLQARSDCSYFQSWGWIGTWLQQVGVRLRPLCIKVKADNTLIGLAIFVPRDVKRRFIFTSHALYLNEHPFEGHNMVIEYNGILAARGKESSVYESVLRHIAAHCKGYDEMVFGALSESHRHLLEEASLQVDLDCRENDASKAWSVDLTMIPDGLVGYLSSLSRNRRWQLKQSIKNYENLGKICLEEASEEEQALHFFDRLKVLHTEYWELKGTKGAFAKERWEQFHRALINSRFSSDEIQLLRVSHGGDEIGYIYSLIWRNHVYVLQTGLVIEKDKKQMPGYLAHAYAITHNKAKGMQCYDLMHGDDLYKRILCNSNVSLYWMVLQRKRVKFMLERAATRFVRSARGIHD